MKSVESADVKDKRIIVRVDWNVTLGRALQIIDDTRIVRTLPTIKLLLKGDAKQIIIMSHLGKPKGREAKFSIKPVAAYASRLLGEEIAVSDDLDKLTTAKIVMLENLRYWEGEEKNDPNFCQSMARLGDIYVNEAFGESHRKVASIVGMSEIMPAYAGLWLEEEIMTILKVRDQAKKPMVVVMGGAKVDDKLKILELLSQRADTILLGGKLANEFVANGLQLTGRAKVLVPIEGDNLLDIGVETQKLYATEIAKAKTIVWNGPMGRVEDERYRKGTTSVYEAITANAEAYTLVGGGDTLAAIGEEEHLTKIDHVSTGGGAMLKLLEMGTLPGIDVLNENNF